MGTSELQLQLQDSGKMHPVRIDNLPHDTLFSVLVSPLKYCSKDVCDVGKVGREYSVCALSSQEEVCRTAECLPVEVKVMDRITGHCEFKSQGEYGHAFLPNQVLEFWTQALDFTYLVSSSSVFRGLGRYWGVTVGCAGLHSRCVQCERRERERRGGREEDTCWED